MKSGYLNKKQFIAEMAEIHDMKKVDAASCVEVFLDTLYYAVSNGMNIRLLGDLTIETRPIKERKYANPLNRKETITTPAHKKLVCKMGSRLQYLANGGTIEGAKDLTEEED